MSSSSATIASFRCLVLAYWKKYGRHDLPWRQTDDPYKILVSEIMLQQTQVSRVVGKYQEFLALFPTVRVLAKASLSDVLRVWSGLGYNRRARFLHEAAKSIVMECGEKVPREYAKLRALPGIGDYTASAVRVFAHNEQDVLVETNVRTVYLHHALVEKSDLHKRDTKISDTQVREVATLAARGQDPRTWHWALMDYGAHLKQSGVRLNAKSTHYTKQSRFEGSLRQVRGVILRELHNGPSLIHHLPFPKDKIQSALASLARDELITQDGAKWRVV